MVGDLIADTPACRGSSARGVALVDLGTHRMRDVVVRSTCSRSIIRICR
jgi:hypothetical protein